MDLDTLVKLRMIVEQAKPKRILGLGNNVDPRDRELQALQRAVVDLTGIIESLVIKEG